MSLDDADLALLWIDAENLEPLGRDIVRALIDRIGEIEEETKATIADAEAEADNRVKEEEENSEQALEEWREERKDLERERDAAIDERDDARLERDTYKRFADEYLVRIAELTSELEEAALRRDSCENCCEHA